MTEDWAPPDDIDFTTPNVARMYDYILGGKDHFEVDREASERAIAVSGAPAREFARETRAFLERAVRFLAEAGISQFIDLGSGLPSRRNVHEVAQEVTPDARVVYVDSDPVVANHSLDLLTGTDKAVFLEGDMRRPEEILNHRQTRKLIDFTEPVGVLFVAALHLLRDEWGPAEVVARFRDAVVPGSYLALSHITSEDRPPVAVARMREVFDSATQPMVPRSRGQIRSFFDGFELVDPGLVLAPEWRPDASSASQGPPTGWMFAGVGYKP